MCHWIIKDEGTSIYSMLSPHIKRFWNHLTDHLCLLQQNKRVGVLGKDGKVLRYDITLKYTHLILVVVSPGNPLKLAWVLMGVSPCKQMQCIPWWPPSHFPRPLVWGHWKEKSEARHFLYLSREHYGRLPLWISELACERTASHCQRLNVSREREKKWKITWMHD